MLLKSNFQLKFKIRASPVIYASLLLSVTVKRKRQDQISKIKRRSKKTSDSLIRQIVILNFSSRIFNFVS